MANTDAMFGEATNPFRKPEILQKYWTWEQEHLNILYSPMPWLTARKAYNARASVLSALTDFADTIGDDDDNSILTKNCQRLNKEHGVHGGEAAAIYLALVFGATANAFPTLYWMLLYIFRDPGLLRDLRAEVESSAVNPGEKQGPPASGVKVIEASRINATSCPLLLSCYTETLRLVSRHPGARVVTADPATLSFKDARTGEQRSYALKKGSIVHMPAGMLHSSEQHWGPDAAEFDGYRFFRLARHSDRAVDRQARKAHIALGGGKHLCPGRHMALAEILATVAVFVAGFELETTATDLPRMVHQFGLGIVKPDEAGARLTLVMPNLGIRDSVVPHFLPPYQASKPTILPTHKFTWRSNLYQLPCIDHSNGITAHDRIKPMGHREYRAIPEVLFQYPLHDGIGLRIDIARRLVQQKDLALPQDGARQRQELLLTLGQPRVCDLGVEAAPLLKEGPEPNTFQGCDEQAIRVAVGRINIEAE
ncbi:hypothetical protein SLS63_005108 [Diaporthe eres]|uniref:Cytochrome P450 n=1 Tax=Diaporthe eres TaxID=83184 RepID=A0ABR1PC55_DIAER